jgi:3-phenylpropionate/trans-cinnamate dioxygenase ferredoxin reductase component
MSYVIVGASLAGAKAAQTLREEGYAGEIVLIGSESELPYERPPLSKAYLMGTEDKSKIFVHEANWYTRNNVDLRLGQRVTSVDRNAHSVHLSTGEDIGYSALLLATGSSPRRLNVPGTDLDGVRYLRTVADSDLLREDLRRGGNLVVVGAGWIGLEVAATARELGCTVTVVEPQPVPLQAALGTKLGTFFADLHRDHGVNLRLNTGVTAIIGESKVTAVRTADGDIPADLVVIGVGARPNVELAEEAGLEINNGVLVNQSLQTSDPDIYAAGDIAHAINPFYGTRIRVEHWANALYQGPIAARSMLGHTVEYDQLPYFFTDQYDVGMEFTGWFPPGETEDIVIRGDLPSRSFHAFWMTDNRVVAGMHVNRWDDGIAPIDDLIKARVPIDRERLADPSVGLAKLVEDLQVYG